MFGHAFFGAAFFGAAYFGPSAGPIVPETSALTCDASSGPLLTATLDPMENRLVVGSTNPATVRGLKNRETHAYLDDATVVLTGVLDDADVPVAGTANLAMPYISGVGRKVLYRVVIPHTVPLVAGVQYTRRITATDTDGNVRIFDTAIIAEAG
jgi:hypothetical protein